MTYLNPERGPLSNSRQLGRLEVSEAKGGEIPILPREVRKTVNHDRELLYEERQGFSDEDEVRITGTQISGGIHQVDSAHLLGHVA